MESLANESVKVSEEQLSFLGDLLDEPQEPSDMEDPEQSETQIDEGTQEDKSADIETQSTTPEDTEESAQEADTASTVESLRAQILSLSEALQKDPLKQSVSVDAKTDKQEGSPDRPPGTALTDFLSAEELDRLIDEPALINTAFQRAQGSIIANVNQMVSAEVNRQILINRAVTDFYSSNADLLPYSKFVQFVMSEVESANQDKTYADIFETTAKECRKRLGLSTVTTVNRETNKGTQKPAFAGSKKGNARPSGKQEFFDDAARDMF